MRKPLLAALAALALMGQAPSPYVPHQDRPIKALDAAFADRRIDPETPRRPHGSTGSP
jgi:hypothetical protein